MCLHQKGVSGCLSRTLAIYESVNTDSLKILQPYTFLSLFLLFSYIFSAVVFIYIHFSNMYFFTLNYQFFRNVSDQNDSVFTNAVTGAIYLSPCQFRCPSGIIFLLLEGVLLTFLTVHIFWWRIFQGFLCLKNLFHLFFFPRYFPWIQKSQFIVLFSQIPLKILFHSFLTSMILEVTSDLILIFVPLYLI